jgi:hypothetical protein
VLDASALTSLLAPGVALPSAVIYWGNLQGRLGSVSSGVRALNAEARKVVEGTPRAASIARQVRVLLHRSHVLHVAVLLSVVTLVCLLVSSALLFVTSAGSEARRILSAAAYIVALACFGASLGLTLWEMLLARDALDDDVASSRPQRPPGAP